MKNIFRSFYGKLSLVFLLLLLVMGTVQVLLTMQSWKEYYYEADQKLNSRLAIDVAKDFVPFLKDSLNHHEIEHSIHYMMVMNPKIEIYLVDEQGKILAFFAEPGKEVKIEKIPIEPVHQFVEKDEDSPILNIDPRNPALQKPFSAAPVTIGNQAGYIYIIIGSQDFDTALEAVRNNYLAKAIINGLVVTLIVSGIIGLILFALLTKRLRQMNSMVSAFKQGEYSRRIRVAGNDELDQLAATVNDMAATIEANIKELKQTDKLRRELIANVAHDLRSPIASIRGYLETMQIRDKQISDTERKRYISILLESICGLEKLIEQLFELSKLDARQIQPDQEPFSIKDLVYDVMMKFMPQAEKNNITLQAKIDDGLPQAYADIRMIERVLSNLIDNAIRYTPAQGKVILDAVVKDSKLQLSISDTGKGIADEDIPHIFDRFYRAEKSRSISTGGSGLGLSIVKKIMEIHENNIQVESKVGKGTTFIFEVDIYKKQAQEILK